MVMHYRSILPVKVMFFDFFASNLAAHVDISDLTTVLYNVSITVYKSLPHTLSNNNNNDVTSNNNHIEITCRAKTSKCTVSVDSYLWTQLPQQVLGPLAAPEALAGPEPLETHSAQGCPAYQLARGHQCYRRARSARPGPGCRCPRQGLVNQLGPGNHFVQRGP